MMQTPEHTVEEYLRTNERQFALLLLRSAFADPLDAPGNSYLGGLPRLPPELDWPTVNDGNAAGLIFAGQVDLRDLPPFPSRALLPAQGVLYFFYQDTWEMEGGADGIMPAAVLYSRSSSDKWPLRQQPALMVAMNDAAAAPITHLTSIDFRNHGHFRFNLRFAPFRSLPESWDATGETLSRPEAEDPQLAASLATNSLFESLGGKAYVEFEGVENAWRRVCDDALLAMTDGLQAKNLAESLASFDRSAVARPSLYGLSELSSEVVFSWEVISACARGLLHPLPYYTEAPSSDDAVRDEAKQWLELCEGKSPLDRPPEHEATRFFAFCKAIQLGARSKEISYVLGSHFGQLLRQALRHAVNLASEAGKLSMVSQALRNALGGGDVVRDRDGELCVVLHHLFGHGSEDHTAVSPSERTEKVLLLRLDCADELFRESEGAFHFWIDAEKLAVQDFTEVELTC